MELALPDVLKLPLLAILGLIFGSFITALSYRLPRGESVARGRSRCGACGHTLAAMDLIPVMSWVLQHGACRYCGVKVSWRYPAIEVICAALFAAAGALLQDPVQLLLLIAMTPVMLALAVVDFEHHRLPNSLVTTLAVMALAWRWAGDHEFLTGLQTAAAAFIVCLVLDAGTRRFAGKPGLGMGDAKLLALAGLALPIGPFLLFVMFAGVFGTLFGLIWGLLPGHQSPGMHPGQFPFAPGILAMYWISLIYGERAINGWLASA